MFDMNVESIFHMKGHGTILSGRLNNGNVTVGEKIKISSPTKSIERIVTGLESNKKMINTASAGNEVAVLLREFDPNNLDDGLRLDEKGRWQISHLTLSGISTPWWKFW